MTPDRPSGTPAGYSATPLYRKLGVAPGHRVLAVGVPAGFPTHLLDAGGAAELHAVARLGPGPGSGNQAAERGRGPAAEVVLLFCPDVATMVTQLPRALEATAAGGRCWVAWPKKASKVPTDLTETLVRDSALATGWVDVKICAVDGVWSGLCLMRRTRSAAIGR